jgi:DNA-directed RNA polymerase subunit RPC12/RpoP
MDMQKFHCANCQAELSTVDAVCMHCEKKFDDTKLNVNIATGKHTCPECRFTFGRPETFMWPENAPFYVWQSNRLRCPHCKVKLRDSKYPKTAMWEKALIIGFFLLNPYVKDADLRIIYVGFAVVMLLFSLRSIKWFVPNESRFVRDVPVLRN